MSRTSCRRALAATAGLVAELKEAAISADWSTCASYRTGRKLTLESGATRFVSDNEAKHPLTRHPYRAPYIV